jgi:outer membrane protein TolC
MLRKYAFLSLGAVALAGLAAPLARAAGPQDLSLPPADPSSSSHAPNTAPPPGSAAPAPASSAADDEDYGTAPPAPEPTVTIKPRTYNLQECLALAERNHPNLWAARARLAYVHAQLDEAHWTPWMQWNAGANFSVIPSIQGTAVYTSTPVTAKNITSLSGLQPFMTFDISGTVPLYTFGKITAAAEAAEANVRQSEWDMEKYRQQARMDVRRAYYGLQLARDSRYVVNDAISRLDRQLERMKEKLEKHDRAVEEVDVLRLEVFREEVVSHSGEPLRGESFAIAALRFMTGVQSSFDIPDEPLRRPDHPLVAVAQYLSAARLFRPEVNQARAGVRARAAWVDYNRAQMFPDIGIGLGATYANAPSANPQEGVWVIDPFNHFFYYAGLGVRWSLDLLPRYARMEQAEAQLEETRALERLALSGALVEVENAYGVAQEAKIREEAWDRAEHKAKQWISTIQDMIDLGTRDENALEWPLRSYVNSRVQHLTALMDLNVAMSDLARASGWDSAAPSK